MKIERDNVIESKTEKERNRERKGREQKRNRLSQEEKEIIKVDETGTSERKT